MIKLEQKINNDWNKYKKQNKYSRKIYLVIDWFSWHGNLSRFISCLKVRELCSLNVLNYILTRFFGTQSYQIRITLNRFIWHKDQIQTNITTWSEPHHQIQFSVIPRLKFFLLWLGFTVLQGIQLAYSYSTVHIF